MNSECRSRWLERWRAIPRGVWGFVVMLFLFLSPFLVRTLFLSQVPDIGDPFDVVAFCKSMEVPPEDDAAGWPGLESLWTKPRGFAKRSNPGHPTDSCESRHQMPLAQKA